MNLSYKDDYKEMSIKNSKNYTVFYILINLKLTDETLTACYSPNLFVLCHPVSISFLCYLMTDPMVTDSHNPSKKYLQLINPMFHQFPNLDQTTPIPHIPPASHVKYY